jgi:ketosteroid isomerase-like protein
VVGDPPAAATCCIAAKAGYSPGIAHDRVTGGGPAASERLARRYFELFKHGEIVKLIELLHPEVEIVLKTSRTGEVLSGREAVERFLEQSTGKFYESVAEVFRPLDDERVVVEGRVRWMDDERILRDDPVIWALEFRDGLLRRSTPAQTVLEAEAMLNSRRQDSV